MTTIYQHLGIDYEHVAILNQIRTAHAASGCHRHKFQRRCMYQTEDIPEVQCDDTSDKKIAEFARTFQARDV